MPMGFSLSWDEEEKNGNEGKTHLSDLKIKIKKNLHSMK